MTVVSTERDPESRTFTVTSEFDADPHQIWELWQDPGLLEKWWGPPGYPATFSGHELSPGGTVAYFMTGPEGDRHHGWWQIVSLDPPSRLEFEDGFADDDGRPDPSMPTTTVRVSIERDAERGVGRMLIESTYGSVEEMDEVLEMGMEQGITAALNQIDGLLRGPAG